MALKHLFVNFEKVGGDEERIVEGIATTDTFDGEPGIWKGTAFDGDIVETQAIEAALPDYLEWGNVREMHQPSAVGTVVKAAMVDGKLHIAVKVVDDRAWQKVKAGVYKGFSIGGRTLAAIINKAAGQVVRRITSLRLVEISLVDRPANPDAKILVWKGVAMEEGDDLEKTVAAILAKAADPSKAVGVLQQLRNACELEGDLEGASLYTQAIALVLQASGDASSDVEAPADAEGELAEAAEGEEGAKDLALSKKVTLKKAGRTFNGRNAQAMHTVCKAILEMLSASGDTIAQKALMAYGAQTEKGSIDINIQKGAGVSAEDMATAVRKALEPTLQGVSNVLKVIDARVDHLEKQPAAGGPILRGGTSVDKTLGAGGADDLKKRDAQQARERKIDDLRQKANTEPNLALRQQYQQQLATALAAQ